MYRYLISIIFFFFVAITNAQSGYVPNEKTRKEIKSKLWNTLERITPPELRNSMRTAFSSENLFNEYEKVSTKFGLPTHDIITEKSFFTIICEEVKQGSSYSDSEIQNRYTTIKTSFETTRTDYGLTNTQKQKKYETLVFTAIWLNGIHGKAAPDLVEKIAEQLLTAANATTTAASGKEKTKAKTVSTDYTVRNSMNDIADIIMRTQTFNNVSGMTYQKNVVYVLYKNGDVFKDPYEPLESLDIEKSKREKPNKWHRWEKRNNTIYYTNSKSGKTYDWDKWYTVRNGDLSLIHI